jgi:simple sugar transport system permease protein
MALIDFISKDTFLMFGLLVLLAVAALLSERSGIINIALEGQLISGVLGYTLVGYYVGMESLSDGLSYFISLFSAIGFVLILTLIFAFFVVYLRLNQILIALALNIIMYGVASFVIVSIKDNTNFYLQEDYVWLYFSDSFNAY